MLRRGLFGLACCLLASSAWSVAAPGQSSQAEWMNAMQAGQKLSLPSKVMRTRVLFNHIAWTPDTDPDGHWATPAELLRKGSGDLLDLVTAYYFTLRGMGVASSDIRMFFGRIRTLDEPVPHLLLALRGADGTTYFIDPLRDTAMTDEAPSEFRPTLALNESGAWRTGALTDLSVWSSMGGALDNLPRWMGVCYSSLGMMGMLEPLAASIAQMESDPPAAGKTPKSIAKSKPKARTKSKARSVAKGTTQVR
jgi:hypothetical protein